MEILPDNKQRTILNNRITNQMMVTMCLACLAILLVMGIRAGYSSSTTFPYFYTGCKVMILVMLAVAAFGVCKQIIDRKKADGSEKTFPGLYFTAAALVFGFAFYKMAFSDTVDATKLLYVLIPAITALYIIYLVYRREFFFIALFGVIEALYIWRFARFHSGTPLFLVCQIVLLALLALCILLFFRLDSTGGTLRLGNTRYRFFSEDGAFRPTILGLALLLLIAAALFFVPAMYMMYCAYAAAAVVFSFAVYFTVLML